MPPTMTLLKLEPEATLVFCKTPQSSSPSRMLKLTNVSSGNVAFKVKTTAPKAYLVRPSSGTLRPRENQEVQIILQPQGLEGQAAHRFLVQAVQVPSTDIVSKEQWALFGKDAVEDQKLNVIVEERETDAVAGNPRPSAETPYPSGTTEVSRSGSGEVPADLKEKYDELVQYTLLLEKEKKKLEADMANLQSTKGSSSIDGSGYTKLHIILVALVAFLLSYAAKFIS
mmetsp:Transcript_58038/g.149391  ORF Transcript_58038/g.149391 Transcript_58038/m.149391 type:complete len:227 (+) Transcript_58038:105-785(+)